MTPDGLLGQVLDSGRYRIDAKLGEGGMGYVLRARDMRLAADVVIKLPRPSMLEDPEFAERFSREVRALVRLEHPHIVRITDVGNHEGWPFAVMQYLPGGSLEDQLGAGDSPRSLAQSLRWLPDIARALDYVHRQGYVHRDVKPANVLFDVQGHAFLGDFGVTKVISEKPETRETALTGRGLVLGTPEYMAPELVLGEPFDGRVDQYALAVTAYEALAGRRPFQATTATALLVMHTRDEPPDLGTLRAGLPASLVQAVHRGLAKDPASRFPDCVSLAREILRASAAAPTPPAGATRPVGAPAPAGATLAMTATPAPVRLPCPACRTLVTLPEAVRGRNVRCPSCQSKFRVSSGLDALLAPHEDGTQSTMTLPTVGRTPPGVTRPEVVPRSRPSSPAGATLSEAIPEPPPPPAPGAVAWFQNPRILAGALAAGVVLLGASYGWLSGGRRASPTGVSSRPPLEIVKAPPGLAAAPPEAAAPSGLEAARRALAEGRYGEAETLLAQGAADPVTRDLLQQLRRTTPPAVRLDLEGLSRRQLSQAADGGAIVIPAVVREPALSDHYERVARSLAPQILATRPPDTEPAPSLALKGDIEPAPEDVPDEPPPLEVLEGVNLADVLADPPAFANKIIAPSIGYLELVERPRPRANGTYTARLVAHMDRNARPLPALDAEPTEGFHLLFDADVGARLASVWDGPARELRPLKCAPTIELRRVVSGNGPIAVVGMIRRVEVFVESASFRGLYGYDLRTLGPVVNQPPQLKEEVMVARLDGEGVTVEAVAGAVWERRIGPGTSSSIKGVIKDKVRDLLSRRNLQGLQQAANQGLIGGIARGAAREQEVQQMRSRFLNPQ